MERISDEKMEAVEERIECLGFSRRQATIARLMLTGMRNKEIATELGVSKDWVRQCITAMFDMAGAANRIQLALYLTGHIDELLTSDGDGEGSEAQD